MKYSIAAAAAVLTGLTTAAPLVARQSTDIDTTVLQFALTLEHLENVFYKGALQKFSLNDFAAAGYSPTYYNNLKYIAHDEEQHVMLLSAALTKAGVAPNAACTYNFPYTDVHSFITLSSVLEGVGTSAYLGGAPLITSKAYLAVAGSILVTEALHTSYQRAAIGEVPFGDPYGTALDPTSVYTLAAAFIATCPTGNTALPFTPFPGLTYDAPTSPSKREEWDSDWDADESVSSHAAAAPAPSAGATIKLTAAKGAAVPAGSFVTFVSGLNVVSVPATTISGSDVTAVIPAVVEAQSYVFITSADVEGTFDDSKVLFGPAIVEVASAPPTIDYTYQK